MKRFQLFITIFVTLLCCVQLSSSAQVLGPYNIYVEKEIPDGYAKVVVYSSPAYKGGYIHLENIETGASISLNPSLVYISHWYYFVLCGTYIITDVTDEHRTMINGKEAVVGDTVTFVENGGGYVGYYLLETEEQ